MLNEKMMDLINAVADELGWAVTTSKEPDKDEEYTVDFSQYTPLGEDYILPIYVREAEMITTEILEYTYSFSPEEHAKTWLGVYEVEGFTFQELKRDAIVIKSMLFKLADTINDRIQEEG